MVNIVTLDLTNQACYIISMHQPVDVIDIILFDFRHMRGNFGGEPLFDRGTVIFYGRCVPEGEIYLSDPGVQLEEAR